MTRPIVLSIAGFDPSAGAGVLADVKTMQAKGCYGLAVTTAITYQNESQFFDLRWSNLSEIRQQLEALIPFYDVQAVKIGIVKDIEMLHSIIQHLKSLRISCPIIWDPVLRASAGFDFFTGDLHLCDLAELSLITPNREELLVLTQADSISEAFSCLRTAGIPCYVKSVAQEGESICNIFLTSSEERQLYSPLLSNCEKHGSGCVLSSAIAAELACGVSTLQAIEASQRYVHAFLQTGNGLLGFHEEVRA